MDRTLEVIVVPVSDLDRAKRFCTEQLGFGLDHDTTMSPEMRIMQVTPPGSGCSIVMGTGIVKAEPGSLKGVQLVERGVEVSEVQTVNDMDGNSWAVQEIKARATGGEWKQ